MDICPKCGERLFKDKFCNMGLVYAERVRCIKCGFWETRELPIPQPIKEDEHGLDQQRSGD